MPALGTGGGYENPDRRGPALALGLGADVVLVDAGRGVAEGLRAAQIPVAQPRLVVLTSLLPENTVGLDDLLQTAPGEAKVKTVGTVARPAIYVPESMKAIDLLVAKYPQYRAMGLDRRSGAVIAITPDRLLAWRAA